MNIQGLPQILVKWYAQNKRPLPWRTSPDPYLIWISEVMLQQTTVQAVIPFYERFIARFPSVHKLASASLSEVHELWAGLGYYSRANNLHKAAQILRARGFPKTTAELLELPGFGPYTARAVASLAFGERVGVLDGNVIRVLSRLSGAKLEWWRPTVRADLQSWADEFVRDEDPAIVNQALMELGATICTPKSPSCLLCPCGKKCVARKDGLQSALPLKKDRRQTEIWLWRPQIQLRKDKIALTVNDYAPFLCGKLIFPGTVERLRTRPQNFQAEHSITHHQIFVQPARAGKPARHWLWVKVSELAKHNPSSLLKKALAAKLVLLLTLVVLARPGQAQTAVVSVGENEMQELSADHQHLLFISSDRPRHKGKQLYELSLQDHHEHRITYSDGNVTSAVWVGPNVAYASDTDRLKERPGLLYKTSSGPTNDIFISDPAGLSIQKILNPGELYFTDLQPASRGADFTATEVASHHATPWIFHGLAGHPLAAAKREGLAVANGALQFGDKSVSTSVLSQWQYISRWDAHQWLGVRQNSSTQKSQILILDLERLCTLPLLESSAPIERAQLASGNKDSSIVYYQSGGKIFQRQVSPPSDCSEEHIAVY